MNAITSIRTLMRSALFAACLPALALPALAATSTHGQTANTTVRSAQTMPAALRPAFYRALAKDAGAAYAVDRKGCARLAKSGLKACFGRDGAHFTGAGAPLALHLAAYGRGGTLTAVRPVKPAIKGNEVNYAHGNLSEWWRVLPVGFEQGFTIAKRPSGRGELTLALAASRRDAGAPTIRHSRAGGNPARTSSSIPLRYEGGNEIVLRGPGMTKKGDELAWGKLRYGRLVVTDAKGQVVPATLKTKGDRILIAVNDAHAVYPLTVDPLVWVQEQKVTGDDASYGYGAAVAVEGTTAFVGDQTIYGLGRVHVFNFAEGKWSQTQVLTAGDGQDGDYFGNAIALDGTTAFIGAPQADVGCGGEGGHLYIYTESGGTWAETQEFDGCVLGGSALGISIATDGTTALVGAGEYDNVVGSAFVFKQANDGAWVETQKLLTPGGGGPDDHFGQAVALDGSTAVIGAPSYDFSADDYDVGTAWIYTESNGIWTVAQQLDASDASESDQFGNAVAVEDNTILVGAFNNYNESTAGQLGAVYVFNGSGSNWTQTQELRPNDEDEDYFGQAISLHGNIAAIGGPSAYGKEIYAGAAYVFTESNGTWTQQAKLIASDGKQQALLGYSVAFDGATLLAGAYEDTVNGVFAAGSAYFFGLADLDLAVSAPANTAQDSDYVAQTIATNTASATSPAITATMAVPAAASFVSATATQGSCSEKKHGKKHVVTCDFGPIEGNAGTATANVTLKATGKKGATILNTAHVANATPALSASTATKIVAPNTPPVAKDGTLTTDENQAANGTLQATDADGDSLTFSIVSQPRHGSVKLNDASKGSYTYTPDQDYSGSDSFTFKANDGQADSNVATIGITVKAKANNPPVAQNGSLTTDQDTAASGTLQASDPDGDPLTFSIVTDPGHGTVTLDSGTGDFTYTPAKGYSGSDNFTFKANDGQADSNTAKVSVSVKKSGNSGGNGGGGGGSNAPLGLGMLALVGVLGAWLKRKHMR